MNDPQGLRPLGVPLFHLNKPNNQIHRLGDNLHRGFLHKGGISGGNIQHPGLVTQDHAVNFSVPRGRIWNGCRLSVWVMGK